MSILPQKTAYSKGSEALDLELFINEGKVEKTYDIHGKNGVSYSTKSNEVLFEKNMNEKAFPASITKILTSIILLEELRESENMTISKNCLFKDKSNSQIEFEENEKIDRDNALKAIMVLSANDVSCAVSEKISGNEEEFGRLMTKRSKELKAVNSNFKNAHGLHDADHYTTALDMALITKEALKHPEIIEVMGQKQTTIKTNLQETKVTGKGRYFDRENIIGGKTGFVNESGNTLVEVVKVNNDFIVNVIMGSKYPEIDNDMEKMYRDAKKRQVSKKLLQPNESFEVSIYGDVASVYPEERFDVISYKNNEISNSKSDSSKVIEVKFSEEEKINKKDFIEAGERVGSFLIFSNNEQVGMINARTDNVIIRASNKKQHSDITIAIFSVFVSGFMYFLFRRRT